MTPRNSKGRKGLSLLALDTGREDGDKDRDRDRASFSQRLAGAQGAVQGTGAGGRDG